MESRVPRIMIAAASSGSGKTTITCALLKAIKEMGRRAGSFKCGPDFIDPMFHTEVLGVSSANLDLFLTDEDICKYLLCKNAEYADISVIEGVMGYYDGLAGDTLYSSYHLARVTDTPVILVVNCKGLSCTVAAILNGLANFRSDSNIKGVILNHTSEQMYGMYKTIIERETNLRVLGYMPSMPECNFESRHLGLITAQEETELQKKLQRLADTAAKTIDIEGIFEIAATAPILKAKEVEINKQYPVTIAVAMDKAFCFYYRDALDLLSQMGAQITYFSPISDPNVPECDGLILGGGYPELYLDQLSQNTSMLMDIKSKIEGGLPYLAECGGFMYLFERVKDFNDHPMNLAGIVHGEVFMTKKLNRFGYVTLTAQKDHLLCKKGEVIHAHEFHYSDSTNSGSDCLAQKPSSSRSWACVFADKQRFIGYPHIHLLGNIKCAENFLKTCQSRKEESNEAG